MLSVLLSCPFRIHLPTHLPSARFCYPRFSRLSPLQYYAGSDSCRASPARQVSLLTPLCLPDIPSPTTSCARTSRAYHLVRPVRPFRPRLRPHSCKLAALTPPNRVRHPAGCPFASGCFPPASRRRSCLRLHMMVTSHDTDFHRTDNAYSQTHRSAGIRPRVSNHGRACGAARAASFETAARTARPPQDEEWILAREVAFGRSRRDHAPRAGVSTPTPHRPIPQVNDSLMRCTALSALEG